MTTESKPKAGRPTDSWTLEEHRAERRRNREYWDAHRDELVATFPDHMIVVYGGDQVVAYTDGQSLIDHLNELDDFTRAGMNWAWPPKRSPRALIGRSPAEAR